MKSEELCKVFQNEGLTFFTGVPDSTFSGFVNLLLGMNGNGVTHVIASNECEAVAIASGYHLATGSLAVVYMQNSGEGHVLNPLTSLCDKAVYSIPLIMMIGWRGEPGQKDEPQHEVMGKVMLPLLEILNIPYCMVPDNIGDAKYVIAEMKNKAVENKNPVALIIRQGTIENCGLLNLENSIYDMNREDAIKTIVDNLTGMEVIVSTTGKTSRELFEYRISRDKEPIDFYTIGSMGCAASIGLGIALEKKNKMIYVFDGDGSVIMHMGTLATIGHCKPDNYYHIVFDNSAYDSTGGQPTTSPALDFGKIALGCGYNYVKTVFTKNELMTEINLIRDIRGPVMVIVKIKKGARANLGRPSISPIKNKEYFMEYLSK